MARSKKIVIITASVFLILLLAIVGFSYIKGNGVFLPKTIINSTNVEGLTAKEATEKINNDSYKKITLTKVDGSSEILEGNLFNYKVYVEEKDLSSILESQSFLNYIPSLMSPNEYTVESLSTFDKEKLVQEIQKLKLVSNEAIQEPVNAKLEKTSSGYIIVDEILGNKVDLSKLQSLILDAITNDISTIDLSKCDAYLKPEITKSDIEKGGMINAVEKFSELEIKIDLDKVEEIIPKETIVSWIEINHDTGEIDVNDELIKEYVVSLSNQYDTFGKDREFVTTDGETKIIPHGIYGWDTDIEKTVNKIHKAVLKGENVKITPEYKTKAFERDENNKDIGNTYIEISLDSQKLWFYQEDKETGEKKLVLETGIVSGYPDDDRATPKGAFSVWSIEAGKNLQPEGPNGPAYPVKYWMPIDWTGVGIHDAPWQNNFGGTQYLYSGSHGCLNTPPVNAKFIFDNVELHTPVIIH